jgi:hypothetical protein
MPDYPCYSYLLGIAECVLLESQSEPAKPDLGIYYEMFRSLPVKEPSLSFLSQAWIDSDKWRSEARAKVHELMNFSPKEIPLDPAIDSKRTDSGIVLEEISYAMPYGPRTKGYFLYPENSGTLPSVIALHDHGGFFYFGKEKVVDPHFENKVLQDHKNRCYGGRSWATELAKKGFAVLSVDSFLWGSRRVPMDSINEELLGPVEGLDPSSEDYIQAFNLYWDAVESSITVSTILNAGASYPGILFYEDSRSVDYLISRSEIVEPTKIACGGLSGGGLRSVFLGGLDPRIKAAFCVGWMSTISAMLRNHIRGNSLVMYVPGLINLLELPDVAALRATAPLLVQYDKEDRLFSLEGQLEAHDKLGRIYDKIGHPEGYSGKFYPGHHKFDLEMQEYAFEWLSKVL